MAKLYYYYGAMGSSKTANALMTRFNYEEAGKKALLCKPKVDTRDGEAKVRSRIGLEEACVFLEDLVKYTEEEYATDSGRIFRTGCFPEASV